MAFEGWVFAVAAASYLEKAMLPDDFPLRREMEGFPDLLCRGGSAVIGGLTHDSSRGRSTTVRQSSTPT